MNQTKLKCWIGGEAEMMCAVFPKETTVIPQKTAMLVPVTIPNAEHLHQTAMVDNFDGNEKQILITPGIVNLKYKEILVQLTNHGEDDIKLQPNMRLASCESVYLKTNEGKCRTITKDSEAPLGHPPSHLADLFERSCEHLDETERQQLLVLLTKYADVFSKTKEDIGHTDRVKHQINTGTAMPFRQPHRRLAFGKRETEKEEVEKMLANDIIEPSRSPWSSNIVLVKKKDGNFRFCVDYRQLNDVTVKDAYPLPRIDECLDSLCGMKWFCCLDLNSGFWQIKMDPKDKEKTAFSTTMGLYQFRVMPFGLTNSPSTFQRLMEDVLRNLQWEECLLYIDDIIVPGSSFKQTLDRLERVILRLKDANLKLKPSKCILFQTSVKFLGHIVSEEGIQTDPDKISAVKNWTQPKTPKQMKSFLGLASYYRRFVKNFAEIARPLHRLCEKSTKFVWTPECEESFCRLKEALTTSPVLAYPKPGLQFVLDTDASNYALGAVLSQIEDRKEKVIAYMSKALNKHEVAYCVTRKELLAVIVALKNFHCYLYGQEILIRTDNAAVSWMKSLKNPTGQVARWLEQLGTYNIVVTHRPGYQHRNADALSRNPCKACKHQNDIKNKDDEEQKTSCKELKEGQVRAIAKVQETGEPSTEARKNQTDKNSFCNEAREHQMADENIRQLLLSKESQQERPGWEDVSSGKSHLKVLWRQWDRLKIIDGVMHRIWFTDTDDEILQLVVPNSMKEEVLKSHHDIPSAGHLGVDKTYERLKTGYYWPGMKEYVDTYCKECPKCISKRQIQSSSKAPMKTYIMGEPFERVEIDIYGPLPITTKGNKYILTMCDCFTKWTEAIPIPNQESTTIAQAFVDNFVCRFGTPLQLHSDRGTNFESSVFKGMCELLQIDKTRTTAMRPQSNGNIERFHRTLTNMLRMYCEENQKLWDTFLPQVMMAYRSSVHQSTQQTPNKMTLGREINMPLRAVTRLPRAENESEVDVAEYVEKLQENLVKVHELARKSLKRSVAYQKRHYDLRSKKRTLPPGQPVWIYEPQRKVGVCSKLTSSWKGPYVIIRRVDDIHYLVKRNKHQPPRVYHIDRLMEYRGRRLPDWMKRSTD
ncbi:hypothetical protein FSP39_019732 [Pinctada imbricata]|uniref:Gag3-Pol3 n=1 Tax=Pinctada imbricata TaxID=66713 RepID=A0AA88Y985_PINIB|nr:hypothetical protein FSP39_019732 [Pinctada imbricata]